MMVTFLRSRRCLMMFSVVVPESKKMVSESLTSWAAW